MWILWFGKNDVSLQWFRHWDLTEKHRHLGRYITGIVIVRIDQVKMKDEYPRNAGKELIDKYIRIICVIFANSSKYTTALMFTQYDTEDEAQRSFSVISHMLEVLEGT
jgi:hypothetical protein